MQTLNLDFPNTVIVLDFLSVTSVRNMEVALYVGFKNVAHIHTNPRIY